MKNSLERTYRRPYKKGTRLPIIFYCVITVIIIVSFWPGFHPETFIIPDYHWQLDILCHAGFYFVGAMFLYSITRNRNWITTYLFSALLLLSWLLEWIQHFIPGRAFSLLDMTSNTIGILSAAAIVYLKKQNFSKTSR